MAETVSVDVGNVWEQLIVSGESITDFEVSNKTNTRLEIFIDDAVIPDPSSEGVVINSFELKTFNGISGGVYARYTYLEDSVTQPVVVIKH